MGLAYVQPGVTVSELTSPVVSPFLTSPSDICLIGKSAGAITGVDTLTLGSSTVPVAFPSLPTGATLNSVISVRDAVSTTVYTTSTDYTTNTISTPGATTLGATLAYNETTTITVASTTGFPSSGVIVIDGEQIQYSAKTGTTFTGLIRGVANSVAVAHTVGAAVIQPKYNFQAVGSGIGSGSGTVIVTYTYTTADYFYPTRYDNLGAIIQRYGPALDQQGNPVSDVTYGAQLAFENGAASVVIQPLFYSNAGVKTQPIDGGSAGASNSWGAANTWQDTLQSLRDIEDIDILVPVIGQNRVNVGNNEMINSVFASVQDHIAFMKTQQVYLFAVFGEDSTPGGTVADKSTLRTHAATLQGRQGGAVSQNLALVAPSKYPRVNPNTGLVQYYGGQYFAASVAGALAGRRVSQALTREFISGWLGVGETRTKQEKNDDAQAGLLVIEQKGSSAQVRHAITLDATNSAVREVSVVRAKFHMIDSVRQTLETNVIGKVIADGSAPVVVSGAVTSVLEQLRNAGDLVSYQGVQARTLNTDPTAIEVRFSYKPAFPLNYVQISFSLDLSNGTATAG